MGKGRINTVVSAIGLLSRKYPNLPVIGNLTGPISTTASLVEPMIFLKELYKDTGNAHRVISFITDFLAAYACLIISRGATLISIEDPTASGEIIGPKLFKEFAVPYLNKVIDSIHGCGVPVIVHICGNLKRVKGLATPTESRCYQYRFDGQPSRAQRGFSLHNYHG